MRIVVSGTHASGGSTLVHDLAALRPDLAVLPDPYELLDDAPDEPDAATFFAQLALSAERLVEEAGPLVAERGPLDLLGGAAVLELAGDPAARLAALVPVLEGPALADPARRRVRPGRDD